MLSGFSRLTPKIRAKRDASTRRLAAYGDLLTKNKELGLWTWNIAAGRTCAGRSDWCLQYCYGAKGKCAFSDVRGSHLARTKVTTSDDFVERMVGEIGRRNGPRAGFSKRQDGRLVIRIHSVGDFYSPRYVARWTEIAMACPGVEFVAYTRTWRLGRFRQSLKNLSMLPNVHLHGSVDPTIEHEAMPKWLKPAYTEDCEIVVKGLLKANCLKQLDHGTHNCTSCDRCHSKSATSPVFNLH